MLYTKKYSFSIPPGEDYYTIEDENRNWKLLEDILTEASVTGKGTKIEKIDDDGTIKITFDDNSSTIFYPMKPNGDVVIKYYDKDGGFEKEEVRKAWETIAGTNLRIDAVLKHSDDRDDAIWTALGEAGISVPNTMSVLQYNSTILDAGDSARANDKWLDKTNRSRVVWADNTYTEYTLLPNGRTEAKKYNSGGTLLSTETLDSYTKNIIATNVRIAQLEKRFEVLLMELQRFNIPVPGSLFTRVSGTVNQAVVGCEFSPISGTTGANTVLGYYTFDQIMLGYYSVSAHVLATANYRNTILRFQVLDGGNDGRVIATCDIAASFLNPRKNGNGAVVSGMYEGVVGFAFRHQGAKDAARRITIRVSTVATSGVAACTAHLDYIILNHAQVAFGGSYVS